MSTYARLIKKEVLSTVHHYAEPRLDAVPAQRGAARIHEEGFRPKLQSATLKFKEVTGPPNSKASWYSPGFANLPKATAQLDLVRHLHEHGSWDDAEWSWLSVFFTGERLLVKKIDKPDWFFALGAVCDTTAIVWKAVELKVASTLRSVANSSQNTSYCWG